MNRFLGNSAFVLVLALLLSCNKQQEPAGETLCSVRINLSLDRPNSATKADITEFTEMQDVPVFRGMTDLKMVPFAETVEIGPTFRAHNRMLSIPDVGVTLYPSSSYLYSSGIDAWIPTHTGSLLLYGRAPAPGDRDEARRHYGSLVPTGFDLSNPSLQASSLGFAPDVVFSQGNQVQEEAETIRDLLTHLLLGKMKEIKFWYGNDTDNSEWAVVRWNESIGDNELRELYLQMTNEGAPISGSGPLVEDFLTSFYGRLSTYESHNTHTYEYVKDGVVYEARKGSDPTSPPLRYKELYDGLRDVILNYIKGITDVTVKEVITVDTDLGTVRFVDEDVRNFPENIGLPSGCAVLRWTPTGFVIPQIGGVEGIAPMDRYCYPPTLYYYCNTTIKTSDREDIQSVYENPDNKKWSNVLSNYDLGNVVSNNTKSIALVNQVKFGVGMMSVKVKAINSFLPDNDGQAGTTVPATGTNLPVTGFIMGRQYAQNYDFTPIYTDDTEYYLYDSVIPDVYLTPTASNPIRTLSLQTPENMDAYICLELLNNTGDTFYGADGRVLPGRKFYLVGKLELASAEGNFSSVVVKGHYTNVMCTINSLAGAYNCVPDLGKPQLVLGIQTKVNWTLATPTTVMLE